MRIMVLSDTRLPTLPDGGHGLGMSAHSIATGLALEGHTVELAAGKGSDFEHGRLHEFGTETEAATYAIRERQRFDAYLDTSHAHRLTARLNTLPVLNRMADLECNYMPSCAVCNSSYTQARYGGKLVNTGINAFDIPFVERADGPLYMVFASQQIANYGWPKVRAVAHKAGYDIKVISGLRGAAKWHAIGGAAAILHPSLISAAPRVIIEAGLCGVPALVLDCDGAQWHVKDGVTGFVCDNINTMHKAAAHLQRIDRQQVRAYMLKHHDYWQMINHYEDLLKRVAAGEVW